MARRTSSADLRGLPSPSEGKFWPRTIWDCVRTARDATGQESHAARERLLTAYYKPVYRFFSRVLRVADDRVQDLTQDFFTRFIEKDFLGGVKHEKSFQNFLKVACRRHYLNWCESERVRRGGTRPNVSIDDLGSTLEAPLEEGRFQSLLDDELRAELLAGAKAAVRERLLAEGKETSFLIFEARTSADSSLKTDYASLAQRFGTSVYDVGNRLAAARKIFREALLALARERCGDARRELEGLGLLKYVE